MSATQGCAQLTHLTTAYHHHVKYLSLYIYIYIHITPKIHQSHSLYPATRHPRQNRERATSLIHLFTLTEIHRFKLTTTDVRYVSTYVQYILTWRIVYPAASCPLPRTLHGPWSGTGRRRRSNFITMNPDLDHHHPTQCSSDRLFDPWKLA